MEVSEAVKKAGVLLGYDNLREEQTNVLCALVEGRDMFVLASERAYATFHLRERGQGAGTRAAESAEGRRAISESEGEWSGDRSL